MNLLDCDRPGFCAIRITASPCEWTWTQAEQEEMGRTILELDSKLIAANRNIRRLEGALREIAECKIPCDRTDQFKRIASDATGKEPTT